VGQNNDNRDWMNDRPEFAARSGSGGERSGFLDLTQCMLSRNAEPDREDDRYSVDGARAKHLE
jgi:hypothetical protein